MLFRSRQAGEASARPLAAARFILRAVIAAIAGLEFRIRPYAGAPQP